MKPANPKISHEKIRVEGNKMHDRDNKNAGKLVWMVGYYDGPRRRPYFSYQCPNPACGIWWSDDCGPRYDAKHLPDPRCCPERIPFPTRLIYFLKERPLSPEAVAAIQQHDGSGLAVIGHSGLTIVDKTRVPFSLLASVRNKKKRN